MQVRERVPGCSEPGGDPTLEADAVCRLAGRTVTRMYRTGHPSAREVDAAHGRIWNTTRGVGTVTTENPDVALIVAAAVVTR